MRIVVMIVILLSIVAGGVEWYWHAAEGPPAQYKTATVRKGDLVASISATGTLEPEEVVDVGAQVAGQVTAFGKDSSGNTIDYRSAVEPNMLLGALMTLFTKQMWMLPRLS